MCGFVSGSRARHVHSEGCTRVVKCGRRRPYAIPPYICAVRAGTCGQLLAVMGWVSRLPGSWTQGSPAAELYRGLRLTRVSAPNLANLMVAVKAGIYIGERGKRGGRARGSFCVLVRGSYAVCVCARVDR